MAVLCRWILVLTLLLAGGPRLWAASPADRALDDARKAFEDTFYSRAEAELGDFCQKNPTSPRLADAVLLQAQARLKLTNCIGALELLTANQGKAGTNADQYLFWLGEAYSCKGDWRAASDAFAKLIKEQPASPRCLEASLGEASARSALAQTEPAEWQRLIGLLQETNGLFQSAVRTNAASDLVPRGYLLLSEAQLAAKDYRAAEATLQTLTNRLMSPRLGWQWQDLLCRIQLAGGRTNAALQGTTNLLIIAAAGGQTNLLAEFQGTTNLLAIAARGVQTNLLAESAAFQAWLLERLGRTNDAITAYEQNLGKGVPAERRRQALLKIIELSLAQDNVPQATEKLVNFLAQYPDSALADLAWLTLGELRLRQCEAGISILPSAPGATNASGATNVLQLALSDFDTLVKNFPQSPFFGKAQLDLGWCYAREGKLPEAQAAFTNAVDRLPPLSKELATAYFRLADVQFQQTNYTGAIKSYQAIIEKFAALPEVKTNLFEPALYETARAALAGGYLDIATNTVQKLLAECPRSLSAARAALLTGQEISRRGDSQAARKILLDFDKAVPDAPLKSERQLVVAATWEQENNWAEAIAQYDGCLPGLTNHETQARVEYYRARDTSLQAGRETNALALFTNFITKFPTNEFGPLAQIWVAGYYYNLRDYVEAERNYKLLYQNTNWPPSELTCEAQLMAGRAAVGRQRWTEAMPYFTQLYNNTNCPSTMLPSAYIDMRLEALFLYADSLMSVVDPAETNKLANCEQATGAFGRICDEYPTNRLAVRAWARRADCYLQWALAKQKYDSLTNALNAFQRVFDSPQADVALRSQAKVGLAVTLTKWAEQKTGKERTALLEQALNHCLDVVYGNKILRRDDERLDPFWTKEAGLKGVALADLLQAWSQEVGLFQRLTNSIWPQLPAPLVKQAAKAQEELEREKANR
jgi:TolA-binding protein